MILDRLMMQLDMLEEELEDARESGCGEDILENLQSSIYELEGRIDSVRDDMCYD